MILQNLIDTFEELKKRIYICKRGYNSTLYDLHPKTDGSLYDGDFGLLKIYETINCLLGLVICDLNDSVIKCAPQSWMASDRINHLIEFRRPIYIEEIIAIPIELYNEQVIAVS